MKTRDATIERLYCQLHLSMEVIGLRYGLTRERVRQILLQRGIRGRIVAIQRREEQFTLMERELAAAGAGPALTRLQASLCIRFSRGQRVRLHYAARMVGKRRGAIVDDSTLARELVMRGVNRLLKD